MLVSILSSVHIDRLHCCARILMQWVDLYCGAIGTAYIGAVCG